MDKSQQIELLRREHQAAIDAFDFDKAESICNQIKKLETDIKRSPKKPDLTETREKYLSSQNQAKTKNSQERTQIQRKFHEMIKARQEEHTQDLQQLDLRYQLAIERETKRPVYEAELKYKQAKNFGQSHNYELARSIYADAQRIEKEVREKRNRECQEVYKKQRKALLDKQEAEIRLLSEKQEAALMELERKARQTNDIIENTNRANQLKASKVQRNIPVVSNVMSPKRRRSASVQSSRRSTSRYSSLSSRGQNRY